MDQKMVTLLIRGTIAELPEPQQSLVQAEARSLREWLKYGNEDTKGARKLALALVGAELCE